MNLATGAKFLLPNSLTVARLLLGACFFWLPEGWRLCAVAFGAGSDLVDGWFSRYLNATSLLGRVLDPIADKVFVLAVVFTLLHDGVLSVGELLLIAQRDIVVLTIALLVLSIDHHRLREMPPRLLGKLATAGQFVYVIGLLVLPASPVVLLLIAAMLSGAAAIDYLYVFFVRYQKRAAERASG